MQFFTHEVFRKKVSSGKQYRKNVMKGDYLYMSFKNVENHLEKLYFFTVITQIIIITIRNIVCSKRKCSNAQNNAFIKKYSLIEIETFVEYRLCTLRFLIRINK